MKIVTQKDIAKACKTTIMTVYRALNGKDKIAPGTGFLSADNSQYDLE